MESTNTVLPLHIYDLHRSDKVGTKDAKKLLSQGWQIKKLEDKSAYCSTGAVGIYHYCLYSGRGELRQITDKALQIGGFDLDNCETVCLDHSMVILRVPFEERASVRGLNGYWLDMFKHWACIPREAEIFSRWLSDPLIIMDSENDRLKLHVPHEDAERAKALGAFWALDDSGEKAWFCFTVEQMAFAEWIPKR